MSGNLQLCRYLVDVAGYPVRPNGSVDPIAAYAMSPGLGNSGWEGTECYRMLLQDPNHSSRRLGGSIQSVIWWDLCPNPTTARVILDEFPEIFDDVNWENRVFMAFFRCRTGEDMLTMLPAMLGFPAVNSQVALARDSEGWSCLHLIALEVGAQLEYSPETVCFLRQALAYGVGLHDRDNAGNTPLMTFLRTEAWSSSPTNVEVWVLLLESAGVNLEDYGRTEHAMRDTFPFMDAARDNIRITKFEFGPNVRDWNIERRWVVEVPVYKLVNAPGTWPNHALPRIRTICWDPRRQWEDYPGGTSAWEKAGRVIVDCSRVERPHSLCEQRCFSLLTGIQDDCRSVTRFLEAESRKPRPRPRSYSQPGRILNSDCAEHDHSRELRHWFPRYHICVDGQLRLLDFHSVRSCVKGHYRQAHFYQGDYHDAIKREMRHFRTRYTSPEDLPSLPYEAYHPVWKNDKRLGKEWGAVEEL